MTKPKIDPADFETYADGEIIERLYYDSPTTTDYKPQTITDRKPSDRLDSYPFVFRLDGEQSWCHPSVLRPRGGKLVKTALGCRNCGNKEGWKGYTTDLDIFCRSCGLVREPVAIKVVVRNEPGICSCDSRDLFHHGCQCGATKPWRSSNET